MTSRISYIHVTAKHSCSGARSRATLNNYDTSALLVTCGTHITPDPFLLRSNNKPNGYVVRTTPPLPAEQMPTYVWVSTSLFSISCTRTQPQTPSLRATYVWSLWTQMRCVFISIRAFGGIYYYYVV
ncbi:unnamed protein product [Ectocarpus fasciculatus]